MKTKSQGLNARLEEKFPIGSLWVISQWIDQSDRNKCKDDNWCCLIILERVSTKRARVLVEDGSSMLWNLGTLEAYFVKINSAVSEEAA